MFTLEELTEKIPLLIISGEKINELQIHGEQTLKISKQILFVVGCLQSI